MDGLKVPVDLRSKHNKEYPFPMRSSQFAAVVQHQVGCHRCADLTPFIVLRAIDKGMCPR